MAATTRALFRQDTIARGQSRAALLGAFARAVTHELRNRVNAARLSLSVYRLSPEERRAELLEALDESLEQLEDSVADVSRSPSRRRASFRPRSRLQPIESMLEELRHDLEDLTRPARSSSGSRHRCPRSRSTPPSSGWLSSTWSPTRSSTPIRRSPRAGSRSAWGPAARAASGGSTSRTTESACPRSSVRVELSVGARRRRRR